MPQEAMAPSMSRSLFSESGEGTLSHETRSFERWISTPGYHSKVELAMKYSFPTRRIEGSA